MNIGITGLGAICSIGNDVDEIWNALCEGKVGVQNIAEFSELNAQLAAPVPAFDLDPELLSLKDQERYDRFNHLALKVCSQAINSSGVLNRHRPERVGVILGIGMGGFPEIESTTNALQSGSLRRPGPFFVPSVIPNMATGLVSMAFGITGPNFSVASACASSAHAIAVAKAYLESGMVDAVIAGGTESVVTPLTQRGFLSMRALSKNNQNPRTACRPFDQARDGFVLGEGAAAVVLEREQNETKSLVRLKSVGQSSDAFHPSAPLPDGEGAELAMRSCLKAANVSPEQVDLISPHATGTPVGDLAEGLAISRVFPHRPLIAPTKSMTGHLLGAAGALESVVCVQALRHQYAPAAINLDNPEPRLDLNWAGKNAKAPQKLRFALNNAFGFGGTNCAILFEALDSEHEL